MWQTKWQTRRAFVSILRHILSISSFFRFGIAFVHIKGVGQGLASKTEINNNK